MNSQATEHNQSLTFSLSEIASWKTEHRDLSASVPRAAIPALQRGLVWEPKKNELLWDSIFRGFPIGALVVTRWHARLQKTAETGKHATYHLLDGQQRTNAIALGFDDPFDSNVDASQVNTILWLDLEPDYRGNSTRNFWIRSTTTAHPWGYHKNDEASRLNAGQIQHFLRDVVGIDPAATGYRRPAPLELWPSKGSAQTPVPLGWLLQLSDTENDESEFWGKLAEKAEQSAHLPWTKRVIQFCNSGEQQDFKSRIWHGLQTSKQARIVAIEAPAELMETSEQEKVIGAADDVSSIEQLFQRLNTLGTKLDGEELAYSMIKAYWPELEEPVNQASEWRMPPARMVSLSVRTALIDGVKMKLPDHPSVSSIRQIARAKPVQKMAIQNFIHQDLGLACAKVDEWLQYDSKTTKSSGLLPVLVSSIAINSREVYLLLLHFSHRALRNEFQDNSVQWKQATRALATLIHWLAKDKTAVVNAVFESCLPEISIKNISRALQKMIHDGHLQKVYPPGSPEDSSTFRDTITGSPLAQTLSEFIQLPNSSQDLKSWTWGSLIWKSDDEEGNLQRQSNWQEALSFRWNREMLLYAQRSFIAKRFEDYNPQRKDLWADQDRPWDFDHILAWKYVNNRKNHRPFTSVSKEWASTIGNLRAWPAADNRSDQAVSASYKIKGNTELLQNSFMLSHEESPFSEGESVRDEEGARNFIRSCRSRLIRIYSEWYQSVDVAQLIPPNETKQSPKQP